MIALRAQSLRLAVSFCILTSLVLTTGCFDFGTDFTYGKAADQSVNGVSVFANLLRERGHTVSRKRRLTKRIDRFDTIVWAPDNSALPPENVVAWLEKWLGKGSPKVLVFVGRSYDAKLDYYRGKFESASPRDREGWQRELAEQIMHSREYNFDWRFNSSDDATAFWFDEVDDEDAKPLDPSKLGGPWAAGIDPQAVHLDCERLLKPVEDYNEEDAVPEFAISVDSEESEYDEYDYWAEDFRENEIVVKDLLTVDGEPFAFEISTYVNPNRKVIIIGNGSFLLNYPLMHAEHRKLASKVADEIVGDVVFLESDYRWPRVGGSANDPALHWSWVGRAPMNYIVPHFLFWGVLYCFVFFPNFGRPKRIQFHPPKAFRSHVTAVAAILRRSKEKNWARQMVDMWLKRTNKTKN
ncbi:DUF4350 domain-containing protein [Mariniblastus fucicola]|uniref:DUF4350 domain-containing protein n=1 Tax=Mariniblastus fucicola TaxID=980251 RepID=A0A5B9P4L1_9BACT|nr:DUF4350 domain-containing protein [Mariniblastus fucicola]QEG21214.1 hypothetical protein MFFC18_10690 [Mariniblastus fucicola]